ncbi:MAG TPA: hypothetical protein VF216_03100 [Mizugakiibacter sp.]
MSAQQLARIRIAIPAGVAFHDLRLARDADGTLSYECAPIERICVASGIDPALLRDTSEDVVAGLLVAWYTAARAAGEPADAAMEDILAEIAAEDASGGGQSYAPGRA